MSSISTQNKFNPKIYYFLSALCLVVFLYDYVDFPSFLHWENYYYQPYFVLDKMPPLHGNTKSYLKIFNVCSIDACISRFRPAGHALSMMDAKFIFFINKYLHIGFKSITQFFLIFFIVGFLYKIFVQLKPHWTKGESLFVAAFYSVTFSSLLSNTFVFRPTKTAAALAGVVFYYLWIQRGKLAELSKKTQILLVLLCQLLLLVDEQAILVGFIFFLLSLIEWVRLKNLRPLIFTSVNFIFVLFMQKVIAPITFAAYTSPNIQKDYSSPLSFLKVDFTFIKASLDNLVIQLGGFLGYMSYYQMGYWLFVALVLVFIVKKLRQNQWKIQWKEVVFNESFLILFFIWGIYYVLGLRHPPVIMDPGSKYSSYYSMPTNSLMYIVVLPFVFDQLKKYFKSLGTATVLLLLTFLTFSAVKDYRVNILPPNVKDIISKNTWQETRLIGDIVTDKKPVEENYPLLSFQAKRFLEIFLAYTGRESELPPREDWAFKELHYLER